MKGQLAGLAERLAREAHSDQVDKTGHPYIEHPQRIAARVAGDEVLEAIAWLHDVVEDTSVTLADLQALFPLEVTEGVDAITKRPGESRLEYYARVRRNPHARKVKDLDIDDNTDPARTAQLDQATRERLAVKYAEARAELAHV